MYARGKSNRLRGVIFGVSGDRDAASKDILLGLGVGLDGVALVFELAILKGSLSCIGILGVRAITV